jgi:sugar-specific transcriptional regulator TrmB
MEIEALESIGLSKREIRVYIALLELGPTTVGPLQKKSGVPSSKIYEILERLSEKGLVSYIIIRGRKNFQSSDPKKILLIMEQRTDQIKKLMPYLESKKILAKENQKVEMFIGIKAMKSMMMGVLSDAKKTENWFGFSTIKTSMEESVRRFYTWQGRFRDKAAKDHLLIPTANKHLFQNLYQEGFDYMKKRKTIRFTKSPLPVDTAVFRDMVIIFNWDKTPAAIIINNNSLAEQYKDFFKQLWEEADAP